MSLARRMHWHTPYLGIGDGQRGGSALFVAWTFRCRASPPCTELDSQCPHAALNFVLNEIIKKRKYVENNEN